MKKQKLSHTFLYIIVCFIIVIASAKLMAMAHQSFRETQRLEAKTLETFTGKIKQNQSTQILENGYLKDEPFSFIEKIWLKIFPKAYATVNQEEKYTAKLISIEPRQPIRLQPGKSLTVQLKYLNTGTVTWQRDIFNFTAIATAEPLMHHSDLRHSFWETAFRPARLLEKEIKPGQTGTFRFAIKAPKKIGVYEENFILVVRRISWIDNSQTTINFEVSNDLKAKTVAKISGVKISNESYFHIPTAEQKENLQKANDEYWQKIRNLNIADSETKLQADDADTLPAIKQTQSTDLGPMIRVGLYSTTEPVIITANRKFKVKRSDGNLVAEISAGKKVTLTYDFTNQHYYVAGTDIDDRGRNYLILESDDPNVVFEILNYENRLAWNPTVNDNRFRNKLELRYAEKIDKLWVINELPMEYYVKGVAEVSNLSPQEYLKAMAVAIRTYAYYHYNKGVLNLVTDGSTKHADEHFHVDSLFDQVYRGYGIEERLTNYIQAVDDTEGQIIKYQNKVAITPYFSRSDGRTRSFKEVWYNDVPWLISVSTPYDQGETLYGHGVGMACTDAYRRADQGALYDDILKYYYTDVDIHNQY
ncbi:SpoIID/LytB domain-containing protein [Patescibacteria group bacterium]|nr:SpoIID/LytB domain-containing protein [Patescibacteria group bacterium]